MSDTHKRAKDPAKRVASYILQLIPPDQSIRQWCAARGLDATRISAWKNNGGDIELKSARDVAAALGLSLGQVLVIAGELDERDLDGEPPPKPVPPPPPTIAEAIERDPGMNEHEREVLRNVVGMFAEVRAGRGGTRRGRT